MFLGRIEAGCGWWLCW